MKKRLLIRSASVILCASAAVSFAACASKGPVSESAPAPKPDAVESSGPGEGSSTEVTFAPAIDETTAETEAYVNPYERFIEDYKNFILDPKDTWYYGPDYDGDLMYPPEDTVGLLAVGVTGSFRYTLFDVDDDGTDELFIGNEYDGTVYVDGLVTITEDGYKIVAAGWDRSTLMYAGDDIFVNSGSGGAALHIDDIYRFNNVTKRLDVICELITEYQNDGSAVYSLFEGEKWHFDGEAGSSPDASSHGETAVKAFDVALEMAYESPNGLLGAEWTTVSLE